MPRGINQYDEARLQGRNVANANSVNIVSPGIVTEGLVLHLDAGNYNSYPISGTTWYDLSGRRNNGTLINGPTLNRDSGGNLQFDGVNDYVDCGNDISLQSNVGTVSVWCNWVNWGNFVDAYKAIIVKLGAWGLYHRDSSFAIINYGGGYLVGPSPGLQMTVGTWFNVGITYRDMSNPYVENNLVFYVNGEPRGTGNMGLSGQTNSVKIAISSTTADQYGNIKISNAMVYNRVLTAQEMSQNFNATRARFGI